jgi:hypothetical protein
MALVLCAVSRPPASRRTGQLGDSATRAVSMDAAMAEFSVG